MAKAFIAGMLTHAREITAVTNQWVNSYKRLITGRGYPVPEAPVYVCWGRHNRSALDPGSDVQAAQGAVDADRVPFAGPRVQSIPGFLGDARRRSEGDRRGLRACRPRRPTTSTR